MCDPSPQEPSSKPSEDQRAIYGVLIYCNIALESCYCCFVTDPVIVVGAGPVGVTAAAMLTRLEIPVILLEANPGTATDWRASTFHPPTLELLDPLGITDQMLTDGIIVPRYQFRDRRAGLVAEYDFGLLADETPHPYRLQLGQHHLVRLLLARLGAAGSVQTRFGARVTGLQMSPTDATVQLDTGEQLTGSYVIAADGASSTIRSCLGIGFPGQTYPERFVVVSTRTDIRALIPDIADVNYIADPHEWLFVLRTADYWRVVWPAPAGLDPAEAIAPERVQRQLQAVAPNPAGYPVVDSRIYNVHQRVADRFWSGRAFLIGDAAHINSPVGGVGLNSGIHDAADLTTRLARVLAGQSDPVAEFTRFEQVRRQVAVEYVQADTHRNTERLKETDKSRRQAHLAESRAIAADPVRAMAWLRRVSLIESVRRFGIGTPPAAAPAGSTPR